MSNDNLLTTKEAADKVGVSVQAVHFRIDSGKLRKVVKFGRILVQAKDVEKWRLERIASATEQLQGASE